MPDVEIAGSNTVLSFPDSMSPEQIKAVLNKHPQVQALKAATLASQIMAGGRPGTPTPTPPTPPSPYNPNKKKSRLDQNVQRQAQELGISLDEARQRGIDPAMQLADQRANQRDMEAAGRLLQERNRQMQSGQTSIGLGAAPPQPQARAQEATTRQKLNAVTAQQHARRGTQPSDNLLKGTIPYYGEALQEQKGFHGGLADVATSLFDAQNLAMLFGAPIALEGLGITGVKALMKAGLAMGGVGVAQSAADTETLKRDPGKYWGQIAGNLLLMAPDFVRMGGEHLQARQTARAAATPRSEKLPGGGTREYNPLVGSVDVPPKPIITERFKQGQVAKRKVPQKSAPNIQENIPVAVRPIGGTPLPPPNASSAVVAPIPKRVSEASPVGQDVMHPEDVGVLEGMQYKKAGITDAKNAVGDTLKGTDVYDVEQGGRLTVWEDKNGNRWAVNGHHRAELAKRADTFVTMGPDGPVEVPREVPVNVLRETDGWTMAKARAQGALENIRDGKGTALDALEVMQGLGVRTPEQYKALGVSLKSDLARNLQGLQSLDEQALMRVRMGDVPEHVAAGIGSVEGLSPEAQRGAVDEAARSNVGTYSNARRLAEHYLDDQRSGRLAQEAGNDLFGGEFATASSTRAIRVELENAATRLLKAQRADLLKPTDAKLREGEAIDAAGRKSDAERMAESQKALAERLDLLYRQESVKNTVADLAGEVGRGTLDKRQAGQQLAALLQPHTGRSVRELADTGRIQLDTGGSGSVALDARNAPEPVQPGTEAGLFTEEAPKVVDTSPTPAPESAPMETGRVISPVEIVENTKPPYEMSPQEIDSELLRVQSHEKGAAVRVFGPEGAKVYEAAQRTANNNYADRAKQQQADATIARMEAKLTPEQEKDLFGIGETGPNADDLRDYTRALSSLDFENPKALGESLKRAVTDVGEKTNPAEMTHSEQVAYATLRHGMMEAQRLGWDTAEVSRYAIEGARARFDDLPFMGESDADFMTRRYRTETPTTPEPKPAPQKALPEPKPAKTLSISDEQGAILQDTLGYDHPLSQRIEEAFADGKSAKAQISFSDEELKAIRAATVAGEAKAKQGGVSLAGLKKQLSKPVSNATSNQLNVGVDPALLKQATQAVGEKVRTALPNRKQKAALARAKNPDETGVGNLLRSNLRSPLTIKNIFGEDLSLPGLFETKAERAGNPVAKLSAQKVNDTMLAADKTIEQHIHDTQRAVDDIEALLKADPAYSKLPKDKADEAFVSLIERDRSDPVRMQATGKVKEALDAHDRLTEDWRQYIIQTRRAAGIDTPDDWGITTTGYFRHLFLGDVRLYEIGANGVKTEIKSDRGFWRNYAEAQGEVNRRLQANPNARFEASAKNITAGDNTLRVSNGQFFRTVGKIKENVSNSGGVDLSNAEIMADLRGTLGRRAAKSKFNPVTLMRRGFTGYHQDYAQVMRITGAQVARAQELTLLQRRVQPEIEKLNKEGLHGLAEDIQYTLDDLWGTPTRLEKAVGVAPMRATARKVTAINSLLKLRYNVGAATANALDPLATLWPRIGTREFVSLYGDYLKPATRQRLREAGVMGGATKIDDTGGLARVAEGGKARADLFRKASDLNRGIGYLYGEREARLRGVTEPAKLHENGMAWAKVVEYASNAFHRAPVLRGPFGAILLQYKGYTLKQFETVLNMLREQPGDKPFVGKAARLGKFAVGKTAVAGGEALGAVGAAGVIYGLSQLFQSFGMQKTDADQWARYGLAGQGGVDLSGKIGSFELPYGDSTAERLANLFGGPTVGALGTVIDTARSKKKDFGKAAERIAPIVKQGRTVYEMARNGGRATENIGRGQVQLTPMESIGQALGFPPVRKSQVYDQINARR